MRGTIELDRLHIHCIVGILPQERLEPQDIYLDVSMDLDFTEAATGEDIHATVNYTDVASRLERLVVRRRYLLIETMAEECAQLVLQDWAIVEAVRIVVHKPKAVPKALDTKVRIERRR